MKVSKAKALAWVLMAACGFFWGDIPEIAHVLNEAGPDRGHLVVLSLRGIVFWVDPARPAQLEGAVVPVGLPADDTLVSIASRPADGQVYVRSRFGALYRLDRTSGAVRRAGQVSIAFGGASYEAAAFSPVGDGLRVVTDVGTNYRFDPRTGDADTDAELDTPGHVASIAYTPAAAGATTLYGIDRVRQQLVRIGGVDGDPSPSGGVVTAIGPLPVPSGPLQGLAIEGSGQAFAALACGDTGTRLYSIDLTTGAAVEIGMLGSGGLVRGMAAI